jgi:hypothetical protein
MHLLDAEVPLHALAPRPPQRAHPDGLSDQRCDGRSVSLRLTLRCASLDQHAAVGRDQLGPAGLAVIAARSKAARTNDPGEFE